MGLDVPFVILKPGHNSYAVVGEAYIHEAMDGEILAKVGLQPYDIDLQ